MPGSTLTPVPPPAPPTDLTPGALALPLSDVGAAHVGRKLRLVVQVLDVSSPRANHFIATATATAAKGNGAQRPTLLVDVSGVLIGHRMGAAPRPAGRELSTAGDTPPPQRIPDGARVPRAPLTLRPGEWVTVVGWLEAAPLPPNLGPAPPGFAPLAPVVLSCVHVSPAREPPPDVVYRGQLV